MVWRESVGGVTLFKVEGKFLWSLLMMVTILLYLAEMLLGV